MLTTGSGLMDAELAFGRAARGRRRAAVARRLRLLPADEACLTVYDRPPPATSPNADGGIREIPLDAICGTLEPGRASHFDRGFRPASAARTRWQRLWLAEHRGAVLPPISVVLIGERYAVRDGHHRVSVAMARGALSIDAVVDAGHTPV